MKHCSDLRGFAQDWIAALDRQPQPLHGEGPAVLARQGLLHRVASTPRRPDLLSHTIDLDMLGLDKGLVHHRSMTENDDIGGVDPVEHRGELVRKVKRTASLPVNGRARGLHDVTDDPGTGIRNMHEQIRVGVPRPQRQQVHRALTLAGPDGSTYRSLRLSPERSGRPMEPAHRTRIGVRPGFPWRPAEWPAFRVRCFRPLSRC